MDLKEAFLEHGQLFSCDLPKLSFREFNDDMELSNSIDVIEVVDVNACIEKHGSNEIFVTCNGTSWYFIPSNIVTSDSSGAIQNTEIHKGISVQKVDKITINLGTGERVIDKVTKTDITFTIHWCKWLRRGNWE